MNIYTNFWEEQLLAINKRIKTSEATEYVVSDCGIDKLGSRDSSGYDGSVSLWMGEIDSPLRKAVFRDFAKALNKENKNLLSKAIGRLEVRIRNNSDLHVSYEPISFESILDKYEELQQKDNYLSEEIYKWELTKAFQDQWKRYESNEISFKDFFGKISFKNLAYHMCIAIYNHILREKPDEFEKLITYLFDERIDLQERIIVYRRRFDELYFSLPDHGANTYEEERTIATLLAFRYPEKYTFYKDNFYSKLCKGLGIEAQKPVYKLAHYYALVENFRTNHLTNRITLIQKNKATLNSNCDLDINNLILSQDILYTTLVSQIKSNFIEEEMEYFKLTQKEDYLSEADKPYESDSKGTKWYFDTRSKLAYLVELLDEKLIDELRINYSEKPNKQAGQGMGFVLKYYVLTGFIPTKYSNIDDDIFIKPSFVINDSKLFFTIDIDINAKKESNRFKEFRNELRENSYWEMEVDENFPKTWESLVDTILPEIEDNLEYLENFLNGMESHNTLTKVTNPPMKQPLNQILYGPPGTGKTYNSIKRALEIINEEEEKNLDWNNRTTIKALFDKRVEEGRIVFSTFHQSMSYEDFIEGIKPLKPEEEDDFIKYDVEPGIFKQICSAAESNEGNLNTILKEFKSSISEYDEKPPLTIVSKATTFDIKYTYGNVFMVSPHNTRKEVKPWYYVSIDNIISYFNTDELSGTNPTYTREITKYLIEKKGLVQGVNIGSTKPYVIIIDEINRGNVSQIFGELITLIEEDKRKGNPEALKIILPYSKIKFSVPSNLYIVGTMNTADRSVEALDTALRRRFTFEEIPPNENLDLIQYPVFDTTASAILKTLNARIEKLLDKDHKLGHSFFIKKDSDSAEEKIVETFYKNIIPLLQEYFFGDFGKIGLVLGKGFVTVDNSNVPIFADFDYESKEDYQVKEIYSIRDFRINNDMIGFKDAIKLLMANK
jgi:5-methylcytosine-specific restriction protein B